MLTSTSGKNLFANNYQQPEKPLKSRGFRAAAKILSKPFSTFFPQNLWKTLKARKRWNFNIYSTYFICQYTSFPQNRYFFTVRILPSKNKKELLIFMPCFFREARRNMHLFYKKCSPADHRPGRLSTIIVRQSVVE